jgi:hypothetical protein
MAQHLAASGFATRVVDTADLSGVKARLGVPRELAACHTAEVSGYVLEGHVPAGAVKRLLFERPRAAGLAVPGMPMGSPGMEGPNPQAYDGVLFGADGQRVFMRYVGAKAV